MRRREFLKRGMAGGAMFALSGGWSLLGAEPARGAMPACERISASKLQFGGRIRQYISGVTEQWLEVAPQSNPAMLEMFRDRDRRPLRDMVPWAGEFAGKYLTSAVQVWRVTRDDGLRRVISDFVPRLAALQAQDGYLGPWPSGSQLTGKAPNIGPKGGETWDAWGHYHVMLGLLLWNEDTGDTDALKCAQKIGDLFCRKFESARLVDTGSTEMNLAPIHSLALLHRRSGEARYLKLAQRICDEFAARSEDGKPLAGDYLNAALAGKEFFQMPKPRWESLHPIMGLAELYWISGEERYRQAFENIWWSIVKLDRHNNGGFSSGEQAQGNPYHPGAIETCCTIAWIALSVEMLRLTGSSVVADEIELATLNSVVGMHSPNGRWVTYNTPMDGVRKASAHEIVFQSREGSPELNCCSVNGARGFGMISDWAVMAFRDALVLNWYGPSSITAPVKGGGTVTLVQETNYPADNRVRLRVTTESPVKFLLQLRIPHWSRRTSVKVNGAAIADVKSGAYLAIDRLWKQDDLVEVELDFTLQFWAGERECAGKTSIYRGPLLLTYDRRFNTMDPQDVPALVAAGLVGNVVVSDDWLAPMLLMEFRGADGRPLRLCDFGSAGAGGSPYRSWLNVTGPKPVEFSRDNPLRRGPA